MMGDKDAKDDWLIAQVVSLAGGGWAVPHGQALLVGQSVLARYDRIQRGLLVGGIFQ